MIKVIPVAFSKADLTGRKIVLIAAPPPPILISSATAVPEAAASNVAPIAKLLMSFVAIISEIPPC
ncbi:MAG TPA: hypothetical protein PLX65_03990 [Accumulibacter sp.]|nr:hypothetical protein [Accumulibacter sp.]HNI72672.1 hypothetical protein [Accumulibacter sp.]